MLTFTATRFRPILRTVGRCLAAGIGCAPLFAQPQPATGPETLPPFVILSSQVANQSPAGTMTMPVSGLRFEPRVDVQARNLAEGQADVAVRGGVFESTGFRLGAVNVYDPQTGHYFAELPVAPAMLTPPAILLGTKNAIAATNASVGTIAYGWREIQTRGELALAAGGHGYNRQSFYQGRAGPTKGAGGTVGADVEFARSESDGTRPFGEHDFQRLSGRLQLKRPSSQSDLFAGYQTKFFGWPNLYTPFGFNETENLQTVLVAANHRATYGAGGWWQAGAYYRRNKDDYEFNRAVPGASNPFQHTTAVRGAALEGRHEFGSAGAVTYDASWMRDQLESTALTFGRFSRRSYAHVAVVPEFAFAPASGRLVVQTGAAFDDTDRDESAVSPIASIAWQRDNAAGQLRICLEYAGSSQVATYTALNSNAAAGLFRGNPNLGRATSGNLELAATVARGGWRVEAAVFQRSDDDLVDWTFRRGVVARTANPVDLTVTGVEVVVLRNWDRFDFVLGYAWLEKEADYGTAAVDASFYALNFPRHRLTAALTCRLGAGWEVRADNEFRIQQENLLRTTGGDEAVVSSVGVRYFPPQMRSLELSLEVDNLWDSDYEEVPAVPAGRRQVSAGVIWRW